MLSVGGLETTIRKLMIHGTEGIILICNILDLIKATGFLKVAQL